MSLYLDTIGKRFIVDEVKKNLTPLQFNIVNALMSHPEMVFSREQLIKDKNISLRAIDVQICRIKKLMGPYSKCIKVRNGFGYCFETD
jgi:DNA-binding response OmpR family regulator